MAERNSKVGIRTKIEAKIKLFNIAVKDGECTEMYVSSFLINKRKEQINEWIK